MFPCTGTYTYIRGTWYVVLVYCLQGHVYYYLVPDITQVYIRVLVYLVYMICKISVVMRKQYRHYKKTVSQIAPRRTPWFQMHCTTTDPLR